MLIGRRINFIQNVPPIRQKPNDPRSKPSFYGYWLILVMRHVDCAFGGVRESKGWYGLVYIPCDS